MEIINWREVTIADCEDQYNLKNKTTIINDGKVAGFSEEIHG